MKNENEVKFTKGPWHLVDVRRQGLERLSICSLAGTADGPVLARIENYVSGKPIDSGDEANARLISAAPELYEFVEGIDEIIRMGKPSDVLWNYCVERRERLLAKANGKDGEGR